MLSFEVTQSLFASEIDRAIRVLYLRYWIENAASTITQRVDALTSARAKLADQIDDDKAVFNSLLLLVPELEAESIEITNQVQYYQTRLQQVEQALLARAGHNVSERSKVPSWKKVVSTVGAILTTFPAGKPRSNIDFYSRIRLSWTSSHFSSQSETLRQPVQTRN